MAGPPAIGPDRSGQPALSVIIPAYNEAVRILPYLTAVCTYLEARGAPYEVLVVDDGSTDSTAALIEEFRAKEPRVGLLRLSRNMGKGRAVRTGALAARGGLHLIADADGAAPIEELERLEAALHEGADLAIGSRFLASRDPRYRVRARWHRTVLGNTFNWVVQRLGIPGITDTQCGFKLLRAAVSQSLFSVARIDGYGFDLELLYVAQRWGYRIREVPINWSDQPGTKVRVLRDGLAMLREMLAVRRNDAKGLYASRTNGQ
ncbi:dolichyl-phosphate beta-glucosyltransferase [Nitrospira sp. Kam-Ns4a]